MNITHPIWAVILLAPLSGAAHAQEDARPAHIIVDPDEIAWPVEETVVQLSSTGPWTINYTNPADDPRN